MQPANNGSEHSSIFGFTTLYLPSNGNIVLVLSNKHYGTATDGDAQKWEIILHCNNKKSGVDHMDCLATLLSCKRKLNSWPVVLFFYMLNLAGVAPFVIWMSLNYEWATNNKKVRRCKFLRQMGYDLTDGGI